MCVGATKLSELQRRGPCVGLAADAQEAGAGGRGSNGAAEWHADRQGPHGLRARSGAQAGANEPA
eukprot:2377145-Lingulodinium_polyedra.AAC.1